MLRDENFITELFLPIVNPVSYTHLLPKPAVRNTKAKLAINGTKVPYRIKQKFFRPCFGRKFGF